MTRYPAATAEVSSGSGTPKDGPAVSHRKLGDDSSPTQNRVLRTVYLPSERADALLLTTQSLQQQLDDMRKLMEDRAEVTSGTDTGFALTLMVLCCAQAWRKDRQEREQAHKRKQDADAAKITALEADVEKTKDKLRAVTEGVHLLPLLACCCMLQHDPLVRLSGTEARVPSVRSAAP